MGQRENVVLRQGNFVARIVDYDISTARFFDLYHLINPVTYSLSMGIIACFVKVNMPLIFLRWGLWIPGESGLAILGRTATVAERSKGSQQRR